MRLISFVPLWKNEMPVCGHSFYHLIEHIHISEMMEVFVEMLHFFFFLRPLHIQIMFFKMS